MAKEFSSDTSQAASGGDLLDQHEPRARNLREHVVDVRLRHLLEHPRPCRRRGDAVDGDVVPGEFLAERLGQGDDAGLRRAVGRGVGIAFLAGNRGDVHDAAVVLGAHQAGLALVGTLLAQAGSQFRDWKDTALADNPRVKSRLACAALVSQTGYDFSILGATSVPAAGETPEYCRVLGLIQPEIGFEVNLPAEWNGRLYMFGNGGYAGESLGAQGRQNTARRALAKGFATAQTNTGHDAAVEPLGTFALTPQKLIDYAFRAVHVTVVRRRRCCRPTTGSRLNAPTSTAAPPAAGKVSCRRSDSPTTSTASSTARRS